ncbi:MAG: EAL domain-containing protein, partial [Pseudomonadota bacterium]
AADFMPHLIQAGHAPALDRLVLERAAILMMGRPTLRLSINLAGPTLADNGFHDRLDALRTDDPTLCDRLIIEVDASDIAREPHRLRRFIERLRQSRTGLAIDNMATGRDDQAQDEMAALSEFRPDFIKIPFNIEAPPAYRSALIGQALSHDTGVVATRLETPAQIITAKALGAHFLQGQAVATLEDDIGLSTASNATVWNPARSVADADKARIAG